MSRVGKTTNKHTAWIKMLQDFISNPNMDTLSYVRDMRGREGCVRYSDSTSGFCPSRLWPPLMPHKQVCEKCPFHDDYGTCLLQAWGQSRTSFKIYKPKLLRMAAELVERLNKVWDKVPE